MSLRTKSYPSITAIGHNIKRLQSLYSPFSFKSPDLYEKRKFWIKAIEEFSTMERRLAFSIADLESAFQSGEQSPTCLPEVVDYLRRRGTLVLEDDYVFSLESKSSSWLPAVVNSLPGSWYGVITNWLTSFIPFRFNRFNEITKDIRLVFLPQLQLRIQFIQSSHLANRLITLEDLKQKIAFQDEAHLVLYTMKSTGQLATDLLCGTEVAKVLKSGDLNGNTQSSNGLTSAVEGITGMEKITFDIQRTKSELQKFVAELDSKLEVNLNSTLSTGTELREREELSNLAIGKTNLGKQAHFFRTLHDNLCELLLLVEESNSENEAFEVYRASKVATVEYMHQNNIMINCVPEVFWEFVEVFQRQLTDPNFCASKSANVALSPSLESGLDEGHDRPNANNEHYNVRMSDPGASSEPNTQNTGMGLGEMHRRRKADQLMGRASNKENVPPRRLPTSEATRAAGAGLRNQYNV